MTDNKTKNNITDEALRRLGGILSDPALVMSYGHTTARRESAWLRRMGLSKQETNLFLDRLCCAGLLDEGAEAVVLRLCRDRQLEPGQALKLLKNGEGWPEEGA